MHLNLGTARLFQAGNRQGVNVDEILTEAEEELLKAEAVQPGHAAYNLACIYARQGNESRCRHFLAEAKAHGKLPNREHVENDPDLHNVKDRSWFREFLEEL